MPKTLIAIKSCARYLDRRNACRDTWIPWVTKLNANVDVKFFVGNLPCPADDYVGDIVHVYAPDTYEELPQKTQKMIEYAVSNNYDRYIAVDDDTFLMPLPEYLAALTETDYVGNVRFKPTHNDGVEYAQGGCYSLSQRAMEVVLTQGLPKTGLEDGNIGKALSVANSGLPIIVTNRPDRIKTDYRHGVPSMGNDIISAHTCTPQILHDIFDANHIRLLSAYNAILSQGEANAAPEVAFSTVQPGSSDSVTICITSCNRHDLLRRTLQSLSHCAIDLPIKETIIIEDSEAKKPDWLLEYRTLGLGEIRWMTNGSKRLGQWISIDRMYDTVKTELIFHCEDVWEFRGRRFMAASAEILRNNPKILQVSLRGDDNTSGHPNVADPAYPDFKIQEPYWRQYWGGFSGNPGLRRKSDWQRIGSYGKATGYGNGGIVPEQTLSQVYLDASYRIAVLPTDKPFVTHTGERRSKAVDKLPPKPKILIAIPACFAYEYGSHDKDLRPGVERKTNGRIDALRQTWINDIKPFSDYVHYKFFYGNPDKNATASSGQWRDPRGRVIKKPLPQLKADEVFLDVPDDYHSLPHKMRAIYNWALQHGYDYVVKADDDTYIYIDRLMRCGFEAVDQMGFFRCQCKDKSRCADYITGMCYTLNRRALQILASTNPVHWAEDCSTGKILRARGIKPTGHPGWLPGFDNHFVDVDEVLKSGEQYIALHAVTPEGMLKLYGK